MQPPSYGAPLRRVGYRIPDAWSTARVTPARLSTACIWASARASWRRGPASSCKIAARCSASIRAIPTRWRPANARITRSSPAWRCKDGALWASFGVMGGFMQPQGHFQVISAMIDDDLNPQEALDRPRFCLMDGDGGQRAGAGRRHSGGVPWRGWRRWATRCARSSGAGRGLFGSGQIIRRDAETRRAASAAAIRAKMAPAWDFKALTPPASL